MAGGAGIDEGAAPFVGEGAAAGDDRVGVGAAGDEGRAERQGAAGEWGEAGDVGGEAGALGVAGGDEERAGDAVGARAGTGGPGGDGGAAEAVADEDDVIGGENLALEAVDPVGGVGVVPIGLLDAVAVGAGLQPERSPMAGAGAVDAGNDENCRAGNGCGIHARLLWIAGQNRRRRRTGPVRCLRRRTGGVWGNAPPRSSPD
ncbi:hypothetical protein GCM10011529_05420 [Polymorphobacter glacialis]|uniref:Uncharacterized protein n=1 Tax=Sandarakinorhabdus glacialis TaxID=1614636 RepID=A0A916ZK46_9SPHN|nr:hypothetical protein GCM10011529_05420 [Polymorphobacter glacialis]